MWKSIFSAIGGILLLLLAGPAQGAQWQVCKLELRITGYQRGAVAKIQADVISVQRRHDLVECPSVGDEILFHPETPDYQYPLRFTDWPKIGSVVKWRHILSLIHI